MAEEKKKINMALHPNEAWLIEMWRTKYRYGEITVIFSAGIPQQIRKAIISEIPPKDEANQKKP
jgi:hypothetical protein